MAKKTLTLLLLLTVALALTACIYVRTEVEIAEAGVAKEGLNFALNDDGQSYCVYYYGSLTDMDLVIPDTYEGLPVTRIGNFAFSGRTDLVSITIPDSVTSIGEYAFSDCSNLTNVYITDIAAWCGICFSDVDSNPLRYAGNLCLNGELVTDLVVPDGVTGISDYAFWGYTSLTSIDIPDRATLPSLHPQNNYCTL